MTIVYALNLFLLAVDIRQFARRPDSIYIFFRLCFSLIIGFGVVFLQLMDATIGYKFVVRDLDNIETLYLMGYALIVCGGALGGLMERALPPAPSVFDDTENEHILAMSERTKLALVGLAAVSLLSIIAYLALTGLEFGQGSYQARYEAAQGNGLLLLFFPAFLPYAAARLATARGLREFAFVATVTLIISVATFFLLHGYRQILIAAGLLIALIGLRRRVISAPLLLVVGFVAAPTVIVGLAFLRYAGEQVSPFTDQLTAALYYVQGDLFPVDAPLRIAWYCGLSECPGPDVILNHMTRLIPRALWPEKPTLLLDAAGYYTLIVVGYQRLVTLSATILGEGIMVGGTLAVAILLFLAGLTTRVATIVMDRSRGILRYLLMANVYMGFFWVREGFANGIYRLLVVAIFFAAAIVLMPLFISIWRSIPGIARQSALG